MRWRCFDLLALLTLFPGLVMANATSADTTSAGARVQPAASTGKFLAIDPLAVRVGGEIGRRIDCTIRNNILKIDNDTVFLKSFRAKNRKDFSYVGMGKHLDAVVRLAYYTRNPELMRLKEHLVGELLKTQLPSGYIGIFSEPNTELWWDVHECSYLIQGLVSDYHFFGSRRSLDAARKLADCIKKVRPACPMEVHVKTIGLERAFLALYNATGDKGYLDYVNVDHGLENWPGCTEGHAYNILNVCMAQLDLYRIQADPKLLRSSKAVLDFMLPQGGMVVMGTASNHESWANDQATSPKFGETCFTAYWIRLLHTMLQIEGNPFYGDVMERSIHNALFAAQSPDGREIGKYTCFEGRRQYYQGEPSSDHQRDAYCCPNNFRRIIAELPEMIYYGTPDGVAVNLYTASSATLPLPAAAATPADRLSVHLEQQTDYPTSGHIVLRVNPSRPTRFTVRLRIPRWCRSPEVTVNGQAVTDVKPGEFLSLSRDWKTGDQVDLNLPMTTRLVRGRKVQSGKVAVLRGPLVFCFNPSLHAAQCPVLGAEHEKFLQGMTFDLGSLRGPVKDAGVRPDGLAYEVKAWSPGASRAAAPDLALRLTEYADHGGEMTFLPGASSMAVEDELCGSYEPMRWPPKIATDRRAGGARSFFGQFHTRRCPKSWPRPHPPH